MKMDEKYIVTSSLPKNEKEAVSNAEKIIIKLAKKVGLKPKKKSHTLNFFIDERYYDIPELLCAVIKYIDKKVK